MNNHHPTRKTSIRDKEVTSINCPYTKNLAQPEPLGSERNHQWRPSHRTANSSVRSNLIVLKITDRGGRKRL